MKSHALNPVIADEIAREGPIPFARFMEIALYEPRYGYYASGRAGVGKAGDFFTSVSLGPVFGEMLAGQFLEMWEALGRPEDFTIIEQGANDAQLACDVLDALAGTALGAARFVIIEPFPVLRAIQSEKLRGRRVSWVGSPEALPAFCGVHFSNELFDAFPVHVVRSNGIGWDELHVASGPGGFSWEPLPPAGEVAKALAFYPPRPAGYTTELRLSHRAPLDSLAARLTSGFLLAIDYGMPFESLLAPHRGAGTLSCHANHRRDDNPLERPGEKDITAHVDFTALARDAVRSGFVLEGFADQHHFLVGAAAARLRGMDGAVPSPAVRKKLLQLRMLLHPESLGTQFHAILFSKESAAEARLSGFQFARDPAEILRQNKSERPEGSRGSLGMANRR